MTPLQLFLASFPESPVYTGRVIRVGAQKIVCSTPEQAIFITGLLKSAHRQLALDEAMQESGFAAGDKAAQLRPGEEA